MSPAQMRELLLDPAGAGAYFIHLDDAPAALDAADELAFAIARVDLAGCTDKDGLLQRVGEALRFPDWFGANWDALADSLGDLSWWPAPGYLLLIEHATDWRAADGRGFNTLLAILKEAADDWRERNVAFWALLPLPAEALEQARRRDADEPAPDDG